VCDFLAFFYPPSIAEAWDGKALKISRITLQRCGKVKRSNIFAVSRINLMTHNVKKIWSFRQLSSIAVTLRPVFIYVTSDMCNNLSPKHHHNMMGITTLFFM